jgi:hypothetical protein
MDRSENVDLFASALTSVMDVMLKVSEDDHGEPSPTYLQLSNILDQLASVAPKKAHRAVGVKLAILKNRHRSYPEVEILIQQDQDEAGTDLDNNNDEQLDQACGTSTALKESASVATETSNGDVSKTIAMVPVPEFTPLVECFINHMDNVGYHKAVACPEFMLTMSSLERSDLIKGECLCWVCWKFRGRDHPSPCTEPSYCSKCKKEGHQELLCCKYYVTPPKYMNPRKW